MLKISCAEQLEQSCNHQAVEHDEHKDAPGYENSPLGHALHEDELPIENVPALHAVQLLAFFSE